MRLFPSKLVFDLSIQHVITSVALQLDRLYARTNEEVDLSSLLSLRRVCDKLSEAVEEHFRLVFMHLPTEVLLAFSPYFLVAWQVGSQS